MDPICHTLVGATLAETGLKRRTPLGTPILLIGANIPDVDVLSYAGGPTMAFWFRRGVTHGLPAVVVWPLVLTALFVLWDHVVRRRGRLLAQPGARPGQLLLLATAAVLSHPVLDYLNTYGMRWLMPFAGDWYYGDTLFIVDPWIWAVLAAGIYLARAQLGPTIEDGPPSVFRSPAVVALVITAAYIGLMAASNVGSGVIVRRALGRAGVVPTDVMVAPMPVNPFARWVVAADDERLRFGSFQWLRRPMFRLYDLSYPRGPTHPAASAATRGPDVRRFLEWARFPYFAVEERRGRYVVHLADARYTMTPADSWAAVTVEIEMEPSAQDEQGPAGR